MVQSSKDKLIQDRIFLWLSVIALTAAILGESTLLVESSGRQIGLADLKKNGLNALGLGDIAELLEKPFPETQAMMRLVDDDVLDLAFFIQNACDEKSVHG